MWYCIMYTLCWGFGTWQSTFAIAANTNTFAIFKAKFDWDKEESIHYNTIISAAGIVGLTLGGVFGGRLLIYGRRKTVIIAQVICLVGTAITMIPHVTAFTIGRVLLGLGAAVMNVVFSKLIIETIPMHLIGNFCLGANANMSFGFIPLFGMAAILPD